MDKEVLEVVLKNRARDSGIRRILDMKWESAVPKGENFTSNILKLTLKVVLGNGRIAKKTFIAKKENVGEAIQRSVGSDLSNMEVKMYTTILREMENLMEEFGDTEGPFWCELIHYNQADLIILEDLKMTGFRTVNRYVALDLDHARLALIGLARYHAMAKVLEERGLIPKDGYKPYIFVYDDVYIRNFTYGGTRALIKGMRATWGEEWAESADKLSQISVEEILKRVKNCGKFDEDTFKCLNHGDTKSTNMMFKYNWEGRPIDFRLLDFQLPHYNSPSTDITFFMYTSIQPSVRRQNYNSLIELYHETLTSTLEKFGYKGPRPSLDRIKKDMEQMKFFGLSFFTAVYALATTKSTDIVDMKELFESKGEKGINESIYCEDGLIEKLGEDIKEYLKLFWS